MLRLAPLSRLPLVALFVALGAAAESPSSPDSAERRAGPVQPLAGGAAYAWAHLTPGGEPLSIGVSVTAQALESLPGTLPAGQHSQETVLRLPPNLPLVHLDHIGLNWNPRGHQPPGIYDTPHLDVHFYYLTPEERQEITLQGGNAAKAARPLPAAHLPADYILPPGTLEPLMGAHWLDSKAPELAGRPFVHTLIFGSYDGKLAFVEPMVTTNFLRTRPDVSLPIKQPPRYARPGYYPTAYRIRYDPLRHEYAISLERFVRHGDPGRLPSMDCACPGVAKGHA